MTSDDALPGIAATTVVRLTGVKLQEWRLAVRRKLVRLNGAGDLVADDVMRSLAARRSVRLSEAANYQQRAEAERQKAEAMTLAMRRVQDETRATPASAS